MCMPPDSQKFWKVYTVFKHLKTKNNTKIGNSKENKSGRKEGRSVILYN